MWNYVFGVRTHHEREGQMLKLLLNRELGQLLDQKRSMKGLLLCKGRSFLRQISQRQVPLVFVCRRRCGCLGLTCREGGPKALYKVTFQMYASTVSQATQNPNLYTNNTQKPQQIHF